MNLSKARFRAIRDRVGLSQKALANLLGNTVDVVKKWENPRYPPHRRMPANCCSTCSNNMRTRSIQRLTSSNGRSKRTTAICRRKCRCCTIARKRTMTCTGVMRRITVSSTRVRVRSERYCKPKDSTSHTCIQMIMRQCSRHWRTQGADNGIKGTETSQRADAEATCR